MRIYINQYAEHKTTKRQTKGTQARTHAHTQTVWEYEDVSVMWIPEVNTDTEITEIKPRIIIKKKERICAN